MPCSRGMRRSPRRRSVVALCLRSGLSQPPGRFVPGGGGGGRNRVAALAVGWHSTSVDSTRVLPSYAFCTSKASFVGISFVATFRHPREAPKSSFHFPASFQ